MSKDPHFPPFCAAMGLPLPVMEYRFHPTRKWRFDWCWPDHRIALEVEGGLWSKGGGRHNRAPGMIKDFEKYNAAAALGWRIVKCEPRKLITTATAETIKSAMEWRTVL